MRCSVEGCNNEATDQPKGSEKIKICKWHWDNWGYFRVGYECGYFGDVEIGRHNGRATRHLGDKAMSAFLDWCRVEIGACAEIAEAYARLKK